MLHLGSTLYLASLFDTELGAALGTAPGDIETFGTTLRASPGFGRELGTRLGLPVVVGAGPGIALDTALSNVVTLGNALGESPRLGMSLSPS